MPVNLGELRTLVAESIRVQRIQELQHGAGRASQEVLTAQFQSVLDERRHNVKEVETIDRTRIDTDLDQDSREQAGEQDAGEPGSEDTAGGLGRGRSRRRSAAGA
ncbi:MAG: hypothetical protein QF609_09945 [Gammaproteobacteria bacterium]|jgi:hypothetical protein|nr:hypothetical protein [Gammaproteobacteria bacterium]